MDTVVAYEIVYYTIVIIIAAFSLTKAITGGLKGAAARIAAASTKQLIEQFKPIIETLAEHDQRLKALERHHSETAETLEEVKAMQITASARIDKIYDLLMEKR